MEVSKDGLMNVARVSFTNNVMLTTLKAIVGGILIGFYSSYLGRKLCIIISCIGAGAFIPLWVYGPNIQGVQAGSFMLQFFVQVQ